MISRPSRSITFVIYDKEKNAKCFEINKFTLKVLSFGIPLVFLMCVGSLAFLSINFKTLISEFKSREPKIITQLKEKNTGLALAVEEKTKQNQSLLDKLASPPSDSTLLGFFRPVKGQLDLSNKDYMTTEGLDVSITEKKLKFKFNIINSQTNGIKLSGNIFILLKDNKSLQVYPQMDADFGNSLLTFSMGERFTVSRFRPVEASFKRPAPSSSLIYFRIIIFTRAGDLIYNKVVGPIKNRT
ncbi:MAG: hypothetical protein HOE90_15085 [Bacteriovoracaceae bacterium]|jgi:hypothetical protein|nr:hypothetical protein [Bacteriovoracaceae bacterium]